MFYIILKVTHINIITINKLLIFTMYDKKTYYNSFIIYIYIYILI